MNKRSGSYDETLRLTAREGSRSPKMRTGRRYLIVLPPADGGDVLEILLQQPAGAPARDADEAYVLQSDDGSFQQRLPADGARRKNDRSLVLRFTGVRVEKSYTLLLSLKEGKYVVFKGVPFSRLRSPPPATSGTAPRPRRATKAALSAAPHFDDRLLNDEFTDRVA